MRLLLSLVPLLVACGTYNYNRAALVPRATPRMTSGQPLSAAGQLDVGASSVASLGKPEAGDSNAGIEVPSTQLHGGLKLRVGETAAVGVIYENGLAQNAEKLNSSQPDVKGGGVQGYGLSLDISIPTGNPNFRVGLGVDAIMWSVPYVEYFSCAAGESCFPFSIQTEGRDNVGQLALSLTPSFKVSEDLSLFGGLTVRQHPTIDQKGMEQEPLFSEPEVESGPANVLISSGAELSLANGGLLASGVIYWNASQNPAKYKGGFGLMLSVPLGKRGPPVKSQPPVIMVPQPYPGQYPPQPYPPGPAPYPPPTPYPAPAPYPPPAPFPPTPQPYK
jgi:hypothetical protein